MHKIQRKTRMTESLCNRVAVLIPATLLKERLWQIDFPVNFAQFLKPLCNEIAKNIASAKKDYIWNPSTYVNGCTKYKLLLTSSNISA